MCPKTQENGRAPSLARLEARIAYEMLTERLPGLRLAPEYTPVYQPSFFFRGLEALDLEWDATT
ncbi:hypothetical protein [Microbispora sp. KK1-11]|uniref:hypothetical protein n=1 Tax=Microbispora sp. KK1-11 TaxID=2053005 RepID=UPI001157A33A|nr:hypothetical protein [Microbispora sp. KK1-11]TQS20827.1 hypothetical protein FLW16_40320 [Microbispora sp. KK1-11]